MFWDGIMPDVVDGQAVFEHDLLETAARRGLHRAPAYWTCRGGGGAGNAGSRAAAALSRRLYAVARRAVDLAGVVVVAAHDEVCCLGRVLVAHRVHAGPLDLGAELRPQRLSGSRDCGARALVEKVVARVFGRWPACCRVEGQAEFAVRAERDRFACGPFHARGCHCPVLGDEQGVCVVEGAAVHSETFWLAVLVPVGEGVKRGCDRATGQGWRARGRRGEGGWQRGTRVSVDWVKVHESRWNESPPCTDPCRRARLASLRPLLRRSSSRAHPAPHRSGRSHRSCDSKAASSCA